MECYVEMIIHIDERKINSDERKINSDDDKFNSDDKVNFYNNMKCKKDRIQITTNEIA